ncbi:MAG: ribosomal protein L7Ae family protein [Firmicutes bacterium ADurb.Bin300]|nr:MAG: ribosomal protein L7Ae family protein [Firmicutes bacterium ADurb.Bin300]HOD01786.1 ribosomal L7Ae/L30e/S12e/Gadd45 family protein [Clostridiales bacterium]
MADNIKLSSMLGICRKAGKLLIGHDAVMDCIVQKKAYLVILAADCSDRLKNETEITINRSGARVQALSLALSKEEIGLAIGKNAAVLAVTDRNLASRLTELFGEDS